MLLTVTVFLAACGETEEPPTTPTKLTAPTVTLTGNVASWTEDANADKFEISIDGSLSYLENSVTTKKLNDGETLKVRAVGDGTNYTTSDWSNSVTYTAPEDGGDDTPGGGDDTPGGGDDTPGGGNDTPGGGNDTPGGGNDTPGGGNDTPGGGNDTPGGGNDTPGGGDDTPGGTNPTPNPSPEGEPEYLGIIASNTEPTVQGGIPTTIRPSLRSGSYRSFADALVEYFLDSENHMSATLPTPSDYDAYSRAGETVYVQIWLNNPEQHTILSLKLNGTKYQVGGDFSSFFIEEGGEHYNCVYVAVRIPERAHTELEYTVTDIEYIADTFINADGTDEFMNDNDTVSIGLPYNAPALTVTDFTPTSLTTNSASATFNLSDATLATTSGGWLGLSVYDGYDVVANKAIAAGANTVDVTGLAENTEYTVIAYIYGDLHDGQGVAVHTFFWYSFVTESAVEEFNLEAGYFANPGLDDMEPDSGLNLNISLWLGTDTATYERLELYLDDELIYTDEEFYGYTTIDDLLANTTYRVRVYYSDAEYTEHYVEDYVTTGSLEKPRIELQNKYSFISAVAVTLDGIENGWNGIAVAKDVAVRVYDDQIEELRYARFILDLCDNPDAYAEAQQRYDDAIANNDWGSANIIYHEQLYWLEYASWLMNDGEYSANGYDRAAWESLFALHSGSYTLGDGDFFCNNGTTYLVVRDFFETFGESCSYEITASVNYKDGRGFVSEILADGNINNVNPINSESNYVSFDIELDGNTVTVKPKARVNYEDTDLAIVGYEIGLYNNYNELVRTIYVSRELAWESLDEDAWIDAYIAAMKGEAILPENDDDIIALLGWRAIFEIIGGIGFEAEPDYIGGSGDGTVTEGTVTDGMTGGTVTGGGAGEKNIANLPERELLRALLAYDYPDTYEYSLKTQMLEAFMYDRYYYDLIAGLDSDGEKLEALISGALNSTVISVIDSVESGIYHYMRWYGTETDEVFLGLKAAVENYIEENSITPDVDWGESYRRIMSFADFYEFYPFGRYLPVTVTVDTDGLDAGRYSIGIRYRYESDGEDYRKYWGGQLTVSGPLPEPEVNYVERIYAEMRIEISDFWDYDIEVELRNAEDDLVYLGTDYNMFEYPLSLGYKIRARALVRDGVDTYYTDSAWSQWYIFEGIKLYTPEIYYDEFGQACWGVNDGECAGFVYTVNGGAEISVAATNVSVPLENGDVIRVKAVAAQGSEYTDSDWAEYTCTDARTKLATPETIYTTSGCAVYWSAVDGAEKYIIECTEWGDTFTVETDGTSFGGARGGSYRVRAIPSDKENCKASDWTEIVTCPTGSADGKS